MLRGRRQFFSDGRYSQEELATALQRNPAMAAEAIGLVREALRLLKSSTGFWQFSIRRLRSAASVIQRFTRRMTVVARLAVQQTTDRWEASDRAAFENLTAAGATGEGLDPGMPFLLYDRGTRIRVVTATYREQRAHHRARFRRWLHQLRSLETELTMVREDAAQKRGLTSRRRSVSRPSPSSRRQSLRRPSSCPSPLSPQTGRSLTFLGDDRSPTRAVAPFRLEGGGPLPSPQSTTTMTVTTVLRSLDERISSLIHRVHMHRHKAPRFEFAARYEDLLGRAELLYSADAVARAQSLLEQMRLTAGLQPTRVAAISALLARRFERQARSQGGEQQLSVRSVRKALEEVAAQSPFHKPDASTNANGSAEGQSLSTSPRAFTMMPPPRPLTASSTTSIMRACVAASAGASPSPNASPARRHYSPPGAIPKHPVPLRSGGGGPTVAKALHNDYDPSSPDRGTEKERSEEGRRGDITAAPLPMPPETISPTNGGGGGLTVDASVEGDVVETSKREAFPSSPSSFFLTSMEGGSPRTEARARGRAGMGALADTSYLLKLGLRPPPTDGGPFHWAAAVASKGHHHHVPGGESGGGGERSHPVAPPAMPHVPCRSVRTFRPALVPNATAHITNHSQQKDEYMDDQGASGTCQSVPHPPPPRPASLSPRATVSGPRANHAASLRAKTARTQRREWESYQAAQADDVGYALTEAPDAKFKLPLSGSGGRFEQAEVDALAGVYPYHRFRTVELGPESRKGLSDRRTSTARAPTENPFASFSALGRHTTEQRRRQTQTFLRPPASPRGPAGTGGNSSPSGTGTGRRAGEGPGAQAAARAAVVSRFPHPSSADFAAKVAREALVDAGDSDESRARLLRQVITDVPMEDQAKIVLLTIEEQKRGTRHAGGGAAASAAMSPRRAPSSPALRAQIKPVVTARLHGSGIACVLVVATRPGSVVVPPQPVKPSGALGFADGDRRGPCSGPGSNQRGGDTAATAAAGGSGTVVEGSALVVTGGFDGAIRITSFPDMTEIAFKQGRGAVTGLCALRGGTLLCAAADDATIRMFVKRSPAAWHSPWDLQTTLRLPGPRLDAIVLRPYGDRFLVVGCHAGHLYLVPASVAAPRHTEQGSGSSFSLSPATPSLALPSRRRQSFGVGLGTGGPTGAETRSRMPSVAGPPAALPAPRSGARRGSLMGYYIDIEDAACVRLAGHVLGVTTVATWDGMIVSGGLDAQCFVFRMVVGAPHEDAAAPPPIPAALAARAQKLLRRGSGLRSARDASESPCSDADPPGTSPAEPPALDLDATTAPRRDHTHTSDIGRHPAHRRHPSLSPVDALLERPPVDPSEGLLRIESARPFCCHDQGILDVVRASAAADVVVSASLDCRVCVWDALALDLRYVFTFASPLRAPLAVTPGAVVVCALEDASVTAVSASSGAILSQSTAALKDPCTATAALGGTTVALGTYGGRLLLFNTVSGAIVGSRQIQSGACSGLTAPVAAACPPTSQQGGGGTGGGCSGTNTTVPWRYLVATNDDRSATMIECDPQWMCSAEDY